MSGIGIIANPYSKANKRDPSRSELLGYILGQQGRLMVTKSIPHLYEVAESFKKSNISILAINGGDGTISQTLSAFHKVYGTESLPKIYLLRGGTMNVLAANLGIKGSPERLLFQLVEGYSSGMVFETAWLQSLKIGELLGFLYADGLAYRFLERFYKNKSSAWGAFRYSAKVGISALLNHKLAQEILVDQHLHLENSDGIKSQCMSGCLLASTIPKLPFGIPFFHQVKPGWQHFEYTYIQRSAAELPRYLWALLREKRPGHTPTRFAQSTRSLRLKYSRDPVEFTLDGELHRHTGLEVFIELGPRLEFLLPNPRAQR